MQLGEAFFDAVLSAIAHGYSETERFPLIAATILTKHLDAGSALWLNKALTDRFGSSHRNTRAISEMIFTTMGLVRATPCCSRLLPTVATANPRLTLHKLGRRVLLIAGLECVWG